MDDFFTTQAPAYDEYMLNNVAGFPKGCAEFANYVSIGIKTLLDLGCGTGLELEEIFKRNPDIHVTGIDLTQAMLDKLSEKYNDKQITLICASFIGYDFGCEKYDCVISFEAMHRFTHEEKLALYKNIYAIHSLFPQAPKRVKPNQARGFYQVISPSRQELTLTQMGI